MLLAAVTSARNPLIPGVTLSIWLCEAAILATEGEQRTMKSVQSSILELLLEIFEGMPRTVSGVEDVAGRGACAQLFEPKLDVLEAADESKELKEGPLGIILTERQQLETFCTVPLVMDFLSRGYRLGLPDLAVSIRSVTQGLRGRQEAEDVYEGWNYELYQEENGLISSGIIVDDWWYKLCLEADADESHYLFPAADVILRGVAAAPAKYYGLPVIRMVFDFVVYLGMVTALSYLVLFHSTAGTLGDDGIVDRNFSYAERTCALIIITVRGASRIQDVQR